jgi:hypothetical protein
LRFDGVFMPKKKNTPDEIIVRGVSYSFDTFKPWAMDDGDFDTLY